MQALLNRDIPADAGKGTPGRGADPDHAGAPSSPCPAQAGLGRPGSAVCAIGLNGETSAGQSHWDGRKLSRRHYGRWLDALLLWVERDDGSDPPDLGVGCNASTPDGLAAGPHRCCAARGVAPSLPSSRRCRQRLHSCPKWPWPPGCTRRPGETNAWRSSAGQRHLRICRHAGQVACGVRGAGRRALARSASGAVPGNPD